MGRDGSGGGSGGGCGGGGGGGGGWVLIWGKCVYWDRDRGEEEEDEAKKLEEFVCLFLRCLTSQQQTPPSWPSG